MGERAPDSAGVTDTLLILLGVWAVRLLIRTTAAKLLQQHVAPRHAAVRTADDVSIFLQARASQISVHASSTVPCTNRQLVQHMRTGLADGF